MVSTVVARGRSMDERLKSLRSLHQMLCVAAAAVLAFAMTPDRSKEYRAALDELETLRQLSPNKYPTYVQGLFAEQEQTNYDFVLRAARRAGLPPQGKPTYFQAIVMDVPPLGAYTRLRDLKEFIVGNHMAGIYIIDHNERALENQVTSAITKLTGHLALNGMAMDAYQSLTILDGVRIVDPVELVNRASNQITVQLYISGAPPPVPAITLAATGTFERSKSPHLALDWVRSQSFGHTLIDDKSGEVLPRLQPFWERIADMGIDNATLFLQERIESTTRGTLSLFGVSVDRDLVLWAGPLVLFSLMLFFWLHLRQANEALTDKKQGESSRDYPWVVCFQGGISGAVSYLTVIGVPLMASVLLLLEHGEREELSTKVGAGWTVATLIIGGIATWGIHQFRARIKESAETPKSESTPVEPPRPTAPSTP